MRRVTSASEHQEHLGELWKDFSSKSRRHEIASALVKIHEGKRDIARIKFWETAERLHPELVGKSVEWDPDTREFVIGSQT